MARPGRLELPTLCLEGRRSIQLSYGRTLGYSLDSTKVATPIRHPIVPNFGAFGAIFKDGTVNPMPIFSASVRQFAGYVANDFEEPSIRALCGRRLEQSCVAIVGWLSVISSNETSTWPLRKRCCCNEKMSY